MEQARTRWRASVVITLLSFAALTLATFVAAVLRSPASVIVLGTGYVLVGLLVVAALWVEIAARSPKAGPAITATRAALLAIAFVAPVATTVALRLSTKSCSIINVFALPWPDAVVATVLPLCWVVTILSTASLFAALFIPAVRHAAVVMWTYSGVAAVVASALLFASVYGDPARGCVPI